MARLIECPECDKGGFTAAQFKAHVCEWKKKTEADALLKKELAREMKKRKPDPTEPTVVARNAADVEVGRKLQAQYRAAVAGMMAVLKFGAMYHAIRVEFIARAERDGRNARTDPGLKGWLAEYAPEVNERTARRFAELADAVRQLANVPAKVDMCQLLSASAGALTDRMQKARQRIEALVEGKSQRQLLLMIGDDEGSGSGTRSPARKGGDNEFQKWLSATAPSLAGTRLADCPEAVQAAWREQLEKGHLSAEQLADLNAAQAREEWNETCAFLRTQGLGKNRTWPLLTQAEIKAVAELLGTLKAEMDGASR